VHLVEVAPAEGDPETNYATVREELAGYGTGLGELPEILALSKIDLVPPDEAEWLASGWRERHGDVVAVIPISSATGAGLDELVRAIFAALPEEAAAPAPTDGFETEHRVYRPGEEEGFDVIPEGDGRFRVSGRGIELLIARHDLDNPEALDYLEQRLREIGVIAELERAGFAPGDEVVVGELEFELDPS
jgi:GTP-binding protein